jgi:hypothetical protein
MELKAGIALLPRFDSLVFVRGVVVADEVDFFVSWCASFDQVQEAHPFLMPVLLHACANDAAVGRVHCCKERGRAVTFCNRGRLTKGEIKYVKVRLAF